MAGDAIIGALRVVLGLDTAKFEDGVKDANKKVDQFGAGLSNKLSALSSGLGKALSFLGITAAIAGFGYAIESTIDKIDKLGKSAQKAGVPIEDFSKLASSAGKSGIGVDELTSALERLSRNLSQIAGGNVTSDAAKAFEVLGIRVKDSSGQLKSTSDIVLELSDKFASFADGPTKSALAIALFGRAGAELIPLLNKGADSIRANAAEMEKLGIVIDDKTYKSAEQFKKSLNTLQSVIDSVALRITVGMLPSLEAVAQQFTEASKSAKNWEGTAFLVDAAVKLITTGFLGLGAILGATTNAIGILFKAISEAATGQFAQAWETIKSGTGILENFKVTFQSIKDLWVPAGKDAIDYAALLTQVGDSLMALSKLKPQAPALPLGSLTKALDDLNLKTNEATHQWLGLQPGLVAAAQAIGLVQGNTNKLTTEMLMANPAVLKLNDAILLFRASQVTDENLAPWDKLNLKIADLQILYAQGAISADIFARANRKAAEDTGQAWDIAASKIVGDLAAGLAAFAAQNKSLAVAAKAAAIAQAIINTYTAATKALATYPPPLSYVAAGAAIVAGLGMVAKIQAQTFAAGGSFKVPGGVSGVDTKQVTLGLAAGEQVDITKASDVHSGVRRPQEITLTGIRGRDLFTGDMLRDLFEGLNQGMADGYRLKVAT